LSYCVIPDARGRERSRPAEAVLAEIERLAAQGVGEIVLTGIHLGRYGRGGVGPGGGRRGPDLAGLVSRALQIPGSFRLRLSSIELGEVTDDLARMLARGGRLARHLHLPLQSGSDGVLARMNRPYTAGEFLARLGRVRELAGDIGVTTDAMAGFPGESEEDFERTLDVLKRMGPHRVHRFPFSPREGTPAAAMGPAADDGTMRRRMEALRRAASRLWRAYAARFLGRTLEIVAEPGSKPGSIEGYSSEYLRVTATGVPACVRHGSLIGVAAEALRRGKVAGRMAP
jgi:threonylcarbamoyladenosine tRNA methylthiotransferase MtaB